MQLRGSDQYTFYQYNMNEEEERPRSKFFQLFFLDNAAERATLMLHLFKTIRNVRSWRDGDAVPRWNVEDFKCCKLAHS